MKRANFEITITLINQQFFMKAILTLVLAFSLMSVNAQTAGTKINQPDSTKKTQVVEASCGECQFHLEGKGCHLAVKINGKAYYVDGTAIDEHGDAHASDGFCEAIRKAEVQGELINGRFKATYFKLIKPTKDKE